MGDPTDTVTMMMERFEARYAGFRDELNRAGRGAFERIRRIARRHSTALNRMPDIDYERPLLLVVVIEQQLQIDALDRELARLRHQVYALLGELNVRQPQLPPVRRTRPLGSELDLLDHGWVNDEAHPDSGFERLHTLTDGMIIRKPGATKREVEALARRIAREADVPMEIDAQFDWVVLLPSKMVPGIGVPNRYYGKRSNGELKVRGIEVRRHNTSPWLQRSQERVLSILAKARNARGFERLVPAALREAKACAQELPQVPLEDLAITVTATKDVEQYSQDTHTRIALRKLRDAGIGTQPGQNVSYIVLRGPEAAANQRAVPLQLLHREGPLGKERLVASEEHYLRLFARSMETLLAPLGYTEEEMLQALRGRLPFQERFRMEHARF